MMPNRLKIIREERGLTQKELGDRVGMSGAQISRLEKGERPLSVPWMDRLARALNCAPTDFLVDTKAAVPVREPAAPGASGFEYLDPAGPFTRPWPVRLWGNEALWSPQGCVFFDEEYLRKRDVNPAMSRMVRILDSSMEPSLPQNSLCLIDERRTTLADGFTFAFEYEGQPLLRRVKRDDEGWMLVPDDRKKPQLPLSDETILVGQAIWMAHMVDNVFLREEAAHAAA